MSQTHVGPNIRALRTSAGLTQEELANASGLTVRSIQRIEAGQTVPRGDSLRRLSEALQVPLDALTSFRVPQNTMTQSTRDRKSEVPAALIISAFSFLIHPILGIVCPLAIWLIFRSKVDDVQEIGLRVIKLEVYWCLAFACLNAYLLVVKIFHWNLPIPTNVRIFAMLNIILYVINALMLVYVFARWFASRKDAIADGQN